MELTPRAGHLEKNQSGLAWGPQCFTPKGESSINRAAASREGGARVGGAARPNLWKLSQGVTQEIRGPWGGYPQELGVSLHSPHTLVYTVGLASGKEHVTAQQKLIY